MSVAKGGKFWRIPEPIQPASKLATTLSHVLIFIYLAVFIIVVRLFNHVNEWWEYVVFMAVMSSIVAFGMGMGPKMKDAHCIDRWLAKIKELFTR